MGQRTNFTSFKKPFKIIETSQYAILKKQGLYAHILDFFLRKNIIQYLKKNFTYVNNIYIFQAETKIQLFINIIQKKDFLYNFFYAYSIIKKIKRKFRLKKRFSKKLKKYVKKLFFLLKKKKKFSFYLKILNKNKINFKLNKKLQYLLARYKYRPYIKKKKKKKKNLLFNNFTSYKKENLIINKKINFNINTMLRFKYFNSKLTYNQFKIIYIFKISKFLKLKTLKLKFENSQINNFTIVNPYMLKRIKRRILKRQQYRLQFKKFKRYKPKCKKKKLFKLKKRYLLKKKLPKFLKLYFLFLKKKTQKNFFEFFNLFKNLILLKKKKYIYSIKSTIIKANLKNKISSSFKKFNTIRSFQIFLYFNLFKLCKKSVKKPLTFVYNISLNKLTQNKVKIFKILTQIKQLKKTNKKKYKTFWKFYSKKYKFFKKLYKQKFKLVKKVIFNIKTLNINTKQTSKILIRPVNNFQLNKKFQNKRLWKLKFPTIYNKKTKISLFQNHSTVTKKIIKTFTKQISKKLYRNKKTLNFLFNIFQSTKYKIYQSNILKLNSIKLKTFFFTFIFTFLNKILLPAKTTTKIKYLKFKNLLFFLLIFKFQNIKNFKFDTKIQQKYLKFQYLKLKKNFKFKFNLYALQKILIFKYNILLLKFKIKHIKSPILKKKYSLFILQNRLLNIKNFNLLKFKIFERKFIKKFKKFKKKLVSTFYKTFYILKFKNKRFRYFYKTLTKRNFKLYLKNLKKLPHTVKILKKKKQKRFIQFYINLKRKYTKIKTNIQKLKILNLSQKHNLHKKLKKVLLIKLFKKYKKLWKVKNKFKFKFKFSYVKRILARRKFNRVQRKKKKYFKRFNFIQKYFKLKTNLVHNYFKRYKKLNCIKLKYKKRKFFKKLIKKLTKTSTQYNTIGLIRLVHILSTYLHKKQIQIILTNSNYLLLSKYKKNLLYLLKRNKYNTITRLNFITKYIPYNYTITKNLYFKKLKQKFYTKRFFKNNELFLCLFNCFFRRLSIIYFLQYLSTLFKKIKNHNIFITQLIKLLNYFFKQYGTQLPIKGLKLIINGRINGKPRKKHRIFQYGTLNTQTFQTTLLMDKLTAFTKSGTFGLTLYRNA